MCLVQSVYGGGELGGRKVPERMEGDVTTTSRIICLPLS